MRPFIVLAGLLFCANLVNAQFVKTNTVMRNINFKFINRDSVNLSLSDKFELIEDSCASVVRYARLEMPQRKFKGKVKDVSKTNPGLVLTEVVYNENGLKEGPLTARFLSGNLQARGNFKNGVYDGKWEIFYDNNKPRLTFEANGPNIKITDAWDEKGNKTVDNGTGNYRAELGDLHWKGKLLNGKPDGTWKAINTNAGEETTLLTETYKNGAFQKGNGVIGAYKDSSRIVLVAPDLLPFTHAETMRISLTNCNGTSMFKKVITAKYYNGFNSFNTEIEQLMPEAFKNVDIRRLGFNELVFKGEISTIGKIINLIPQSYQNDVFVRALSRQLQKLPLLEPATVDGKPVTEKFIITFTFNDGVYRYNYSFLPVEVK
ncbi:toxin-antitoxin system YwqK family antitoxin [Mucilaginibacter calamicampi]|uniref:Toxin-antitoxin system YwqK family antitoxin n=1 Tax=Mucilaginibacter calamicampi TaxID=1302352 RepID=A0ABW2Z134_9SPHI